MTAKRSPSTVIKRSIVVRGHATSVSLEEAFWSALKGLAGEWGRSVAALVAEIDQGRGQANLSSAIRVFVLEAEVARSSGIERARAAG